MMTTLAFVPARGGSKRIPGKNLREVNGRSLLARAIDSALGIMPGDDMVTVPTSIDRVVVSTDDDGAWNIAHDMAVERHDRPAQLAHDHAQIEDALDHYLRRCDDKPDVIVILQPTSPLRTATHVREALALLERTGGDSVVSVCVGHEHHFAGRLKPGEWLTHGRSILYEDTPASEQVITASLWQPFRPSDADRPRTQDVGPRGHENGALWAFKRTAYEATRSRTPGRCFAYVMGAEESIDVDEPHDIERAEDAERRVQRWAKEGR